MTAAAAGAGAGGGDASAVAVGRDPVGGGAASTTVDDWRAWSVSCYAASGYQSAGRPEVDGEGMMPGEGPAASEQPATGLPLSLSSPEERRSSFADGLPPVATVAPPSAELVSSLIGRDFIGPIDVFWIVPGTFEEGSSSSEEMDAAGGNSMPQTKPIDANILTSYPIDWRCPLGRISPRLTVYGRRFGACEAACGAGRFGAVPRPGASGDPRGCFTCPPGHWCEQRATAVPRACPPGTHQPHAGAKNVSSCLLCEPGTFSALAANPNATCEACIDASGDLANRARASGGAASNSNRTACMAPQLNPDELNPAAHAQPADAAARLLAASVGAAAVDISDGPSCDRRGGVVGESCGICAETGIRM